jgi:hypothetical protein
MTQWIVMAAAIVVICTALAVLVIVLWDWNKQGNMATPYYSSTWNVEMWSISQGFCVNLVFVNNTILGRNIIYSAYPNVPQEEIDRCISREHCMIYEQEGTIWVWNLSAVNPATINGVRLNVPHPLLPGNRLGMGNSTFLVTRVDRIE